MREAQRIAGELRQQNPDMRNSPATPEDWYPSLSAPGTEAFKQDFSKWESLKKNLLMALERTESRLASQLRERENRERLNAGGHEGVSDDVPGDGRSVLPIPGLPAETPALGRNVDPMRFAVALPWWGYALAFGVAGLLAWAAYARASVQLTAAQRAGLTLLRATTLFLLVAALLRPVPIVPSDAVGHRLVPMLVDISRSMRLDRRRRHRAHRAGARAGASICELLGRHYRVEMADVRRTLARATPDDSSPPPRGAAT